MDLKQNTAYTVLLGPFVKTSDAVTSSTATKKAYVSKNFGVPAATTGVISVSSTLVSWYKIPVTAANVDTLGNLRVISRSTAATQGYLQVWQDFNVVPANVWDSKYSTDKLQVDVIQVAGSSSDANDIDNILAAVTALNDLSTTDVLTQTEAALDAHTIDTGVTLDKAMKDINGKLNRVSYKDGNEYKFYGTTGAYLFSLTIATTARTRTS